MNASYEVSKRTKPRISISRISPGGASEIAALTFLPEEEDRDLASIRNVSFSILAIFTLLHTRATWREVERTRTSRLENRVATPNEHRPYTDVTIHRFQGLLSA